MAGNGGMCDAFRNNTEYQFMTGGNGWHTPVVLLTTQ